MGADGAKIAGTGTTPRENGVQGQFCGLCGTYLRPVDAGRCQQCGAVTWYELTPEAQAWKAKQERQQADFDAYWHGLTPAERIAARKRAERRHFGLSWDSEPDEKQARYCSRCGR